MLGMSWPPAGTARPHIEDGGGDEDQAGDQAAKDGLRIAEYEPDRDRRLLRPIAMRSRLPGSHGRRLASGQEDQQQPRDGEARDAHGDPELVPLEAARERRADRELARRAAGHSEHLGRPDERRHARGREFSGGDIGGADQREHPPRLEGSVRMPR